MNDKEEQIEHLVRLFSIAELRNLLKDTASEEEEQMLLEAIARRHEKWKHKKPSSRKTHTRVNFRGRW